MRPAFLVVLIVLIVVGLALIAFAPDSRSRGEFRSPPPYAVDPEPYPTIESEAIAVGNLVGVEIPGDPQTGVRPVRVRRVEDVNDYVVLEHFNPLGCTIGVHGNECVIRTALKRGERIRFFPAESI